MKAGNKIEWELCPHCGHKLFKVIDMPDGTEIEIKCHSCKSIIVIKGGLRNERNKNTESKGN